MLSSGGEDSCALALTHLSPDGDQGYPGDLMVTVTYLLTSGDDLVLTYRAMANAPTPVNLTNHSYFNLGGSETIIGFHNYSASISSADTMNILEIFLPSLTIF